MLRVEDIDVFYGDLRALQDVSFEVREGEIVALVGANGAGKSSTLMAISGIIKPKKGKIIFRDRQIQGFDPSQIVELGISQVPEGRQLFPSLTVLENLEMGAQSHRAKERKKMTLEWIFELFPLLKVKRDQLAGTLSGGEQQMLAIGRGLMSLPELLMLDEPSLGLAPLFVSKIFGIIQEINRMGTSVLLVEQNVQQALKICHRAYVLENGTVVLSGTGEELLKNPHVKTAYLGL